MWTAHHQNRADRDESRFCGVGEEGFEAAFFK